MTCEERKDLMLLYVTDALDAAEAAEVRAHLATGCPACAGSLAEAHAILAHIPLATDRVAPPSSAKEKLMNRISGAERGPIPMPTTRPARSGVGRMIFASAIAACIGALIVGATLWWPERQKAQLVERQNVQLVALAGGEPQPKASGRILWDKDKNNWHVYIFDLKPPAPGQEYELWFITPAQKKVPAGMFTVDASGKASITVKVPADLGPIALAAVTNEPIGGVQQPTGSIQLYGEVK